MNVDSGFFRGGLDGFLIFDYSEVVGWINVEAVGCFRGIGCRYLIGLLYRSGPKITNRQFKRGRVVPL